MEEINASEDFKWYYFIFLVFFIIGGLFIGQFVALMTLVVFYGFDLEQLVDILQNIPQDNQGRWITLLNLGITSIFTFFLAPLTYLKSIEKKSWQELNPKPKLLIGALFLSILITLSIMPFNALLIEWNMQLKFPDFLSGFEEWALQKELELKEVTDFLTNFQNIPQFLVGLIIIAVVPALGEEVLFRGIIQRNISNYISPHLAILLSALIFSAIHIQFYGFFPRMLLGILFGYLYFWSGNIWTAILAHFVNNAFTLLMVYLYKQEQLNYDVENTESVPLSMALISLALSLGLIFLFRYIHQRRQITTAPENN